MLSFVESKKMLEIFAIFAPLFIVTGDYYEEATEIFENKCRDRKFFIEINSNAQIHYWKM